MGYKLIFISDLNMGGQLLGEAPGADQDYGLLAPGRIIHEVGTKIGRAHV